MSDTPRTDAHAYDCEYRGDMGSRFTADPGKLDPYGDHVPADFARLLESELNAAKAELAELKKSSVSYTTKRKPALTERQTPPRTTNSATR